jgi:hypothetical protein
MCRRRGPSVTGLNKHTSTCSSTIWTWPPPGSSTWARPLTDGVVDHEDESFRVYADADGHPFCLIQQANPDL